MAKFVFPMEQLLSIKQKLEKQEQMALNQAMQDHEKAQYALENAKEKEYEAVMQAQALLNQGSIQTNRIKTAHDKQKYYHEDVAHKMTVVKQTEEALDLAKERVREALRERKTYEILKEKAYEAYLEEEKLEEAKRLDEIVSFKYRE